jgi:hypothetical protein
MVFEEPLALHAVRVMKLNAFCLRVAMKHLLRLDVCIGRLGDEGMPFRYPRIGIPGLAH